MKKCIFFIFMGFGFLSLMAQNGQLLNPGFENWTEEVIFRNSINVEIV